jgi:GrpB-like predicted nucleotidyltransferase (UPF0157 family)
MSLMSKVIVSLYRHEWPEVFSVVREELHSVFAPAAIAIEHIGSTSVPGLAAKPVIDVMIGARSLAEIEAKIEPLSTLGYEYVSKYERELPMRRYFVNASVRSLRVHVHGLERDSRSWREHLAFRDALRADADLRERYQALKLRLAEEFAEDKPAYTEAKAPFIRSFLDMLSERQSIG